MKIIILMYAFILAFNINFFAQEINEYSLNIIYCKNEGFVEAIIKNQTQKNIKIENPNLFSRIFFGQSKYWNLKIMDENNNIIHCYPLSYYNHVIPNEKKWISTLKKNNSIKFEIPMKIDELFCLDLKTDKTYMTKSVYIQLCCELIEPKKIFIESNIIEVN